MNLTPITAQQGHKYRHRGEIVIAAESGAQGETIKVISPRLYGFSVSTAQVGDLTPEPMKYLQGGMP